MFIAKTKGGYRKDGEQWSSGDFLLMMLPGDIGRISIKDTPIHCLVRFARLHQLGHFMMGALTIDAIRIPLSGSYGADGLPRDVPDRIYRRGVPLPQELRDAWNKGEGWNGAGNEGPAIRAWALEHLDALRLAGKSRRAVEHPSPQGGQ